MKKKKKMQGEFMAIEVFSGNKNWLVGLLNRVRWILHIFAE